MHEIPGKKDIQKNVFERRHDRQLQGYNK